MITEIIGWIGSIALSICAIPQVIKTWKTKSANDLSWGFLLLWFKGEILTFAYILYSDYASQVYHLPLYVNYVFNSALVVYLIYAKHYYSHKTVEGR